MDTADNHKKGTATLPQKLLAVAIIAIIALMAAGIGFCARSAGTRQSKVKDDVSTYASRFKRYTASTDQTWGSRFDTIIDTQTGGVYLCWCSGTGVRTVGGITPLLDESGEPTIADSSQDGTSVEDRFAKYSASNGSSWGSRFDTIIDTQTGVVYLRWYSGAGKSTVGGIAPLLDQTGKPTIDKEFVDTMWGELAPA